ncbi:MAG: hypothetical protein JSV33_16205 [bacterium]|nr:MAG: hypothetical protein JSV33_16205 [bacterium]
MEESPETQTIEEAGRPSDRSRWIAAISYLVFFCFLSLWKSQKDPFIKFHARQGFLLLLAECVAIVVIIIFDITIGKLRLIGLVIVGLLQLITGLGALTLSVIGFVKAIFGEYWNLPFLGEYRDRVPDLRGHGN